MPLRFESNLEFLIIRHMEELIELKRKQGDVDFQASLLQFSIEYKITYSTVWKYANNKVSRPSLDVLARFCDILECDLCDIYIKTRAPKAKDDKDKGKAK